MGSGVLVKWHQTWVLSVLTQLGRDINVNDACDPAEWWRWLLRRMLGQRLSLVLSKENFQQNKKSPSCKLNAREVRKETISASFCDCLPFKLRKGRFCAAFPETTGRNINTGPISNLCCLELARMMSLKIGHTACNSFNFHNIYCKSKIFYGCRLQSLQTSEVEFWPTVPWNGLVLSLWKSWRSWILVLDTPLYLVCCKTTTKEALINQSTNRRRNKLDAPRIDCGNYQESEKLCGFW